MMRTNCRGRNFSPKSPRLAKDLIFLRRLTRLIFSAIPGVPIVRGSGLQLVR
jgi:hypothetical protein